MKCVRKSLPWQRYIKPDFNTLMDPWLKCQPFVDPEMNLKDRVKMQDLLFALRYDQNTPNHRFEFMYCWYVSPSGNTIVFCDPKDCQFLKLNKDQIAHSLQNHGFKWLTKSCW